MEKKYLFSKDGYFHLHENKSLDNGEVAIARIYDSQKMLAFSYANGFEVNHGGALKMAELPFKRIPEIADINFMLCYRTEIFHSLIGTETAFWLKDTCGLKEAFYVSMRQGDMFDVSLCAAELAKMDVRFIYHLNKMINLKT